MLTPDAPFRIDDSDHREVDRLLTEGLLDPLLPGVVGPAGCAAHGEARISAAALALPDRVRDRVVVAQGAAAWIWCGGPPPAVIDVVVGPGTALPRLPVLASHERRMPPQDVVLLRADGLHVAVTSATRTLVDLVRLLPEATALPAVAPLLALPGVTADGVVACLERMPRARGVTRARSLAATLAYSARAPEAAADPGTTGPSPQSIRLPVIR